LQRVPDDDSLEGPREVSRGAVLLTALNPSLAQQESSGRQGPGRIHLDADPDSTYCPEADPDKDPDSDLYLLRMRIYVRIRLFTLMRIRIRIQILASK
jgi:hypothetical protein